MTESTASAASTLFWGHTAAFWDTALIWSVIFAFVVAGFVGVSTIGSIRANRLEADKAEAELSAYKAGVDDRAKAAELEIERQKADVAKANESAEIARLEQERLKQIVQWRTLSKADMDSLVAELSKGSGDVDLAFAPSDPESKYFALAVLGQAFKAANAKAGAIKWHVFLREWVTEGMYFGMTIPGPETTQVKLLRHAFAGAHIEFATLDAPEERSPITVGSGLQWTPAPKHDALIFVGLRHPPAP